MTDALSDGRAQVACPNCEKKMRLERLNDHLDLCLVDSAATRPANIDSTVDADDDDHSPGAPRKRARISPDGLDPGSQPQGVLGSMMAASRQATQSSHTPSRSGGNKPRTPIERHAFASVPGMPTSNGPKGRAHPQSAAPGYGMGIGYTSSAAEVGAAKWLDSSVGPLSSSASGNAAGLDAAPLAERMRPQTLSDFVGQAPAVSTLRALLRAPRGPPSLILWAPPGTGKTTLARIIAYHLKFPVTLDNDAGPNSVSSVGDKWRMVEISAITTTLQEIKKTLDDAGARLGRMGTRTMVLVDEFQRINRGWQDAFLAAVERGTITLVAATTENPSFRIVPALLSRMRVVLLHRLEEKDVATILRRAQNLTFGEPYSSGSPDSNITKPEPSSPVSSTTTSTATLPEAIFSFGRDDNDDQREKKPGRGGNDRPRSHSPPTHPPKSRERPVPDGVLQYIAANADGDARTALNTLELAWALAGEVLDPNRTREGVNPQAREAQATKEVVQALRTARVRSGLAYDRSGDWHYDAISALHKSIRGGDASAAVYWLARMVAAGDDPLYVARRMIIAASEDCGSNPMALQMAMATYQAVQVVGLPEAGETLAQTAVYLAESPKDTRAYRAWQRANKLVHSTPSYPIPMHIRNAPTKLMKDLGALKNYRYEPRFLHPVVQSFLPTPLQDRERICSPPPIEDEMPYAAPSDDEGERLEVERAVGLPPRTRPQDRPLSAMEGAVVHRWPMVHDGGTGGGEGYDQAADLSSPVHVLPSVSGTGVGACQHIFDVGSRVVDFSLLAEWENERNGGMPWEGRTGLMRTIRRMGQREQTRN